MPKESILAKCVKSHLKGNKDFAYIAEGGRHFLGHNGVLIAEIKDDYIEFASVHLLSANPKFFNNIDKYLDFLRQMK